MIQNMRLEFNLRHDIEPFLRCWESSRSLFERESGVEIDMGIELPSRITGIDPDIIMNVVNSHKSLWCTFIRERRLAMPEQLCDRNQSLKLG